MTCAVRLTLPFSGRDQKRVVALPSLNSPKRLRRRWEVLGEFAKYAFCGLKRKRRDFERSVLKYVSIKIPALTHSGRKSRVCVNQPDRLLPPEQRASPPLPFFKSKSSMHSALQARRFAFRRSWDACAASGFACTAVDNWFLLPIGHIISPSGEVWDACAARGKVGPVMGLRPLHPDAKSRFTGFGPPSASAPPGGKARKSVAYGAAKPRPTPDFRSC